MMPITYADDLVEAAVLLAERTAPVAMTRVFRHARNRLYDVEDVDGRETAFNALHKDWFFKLGLPMPIEQAIAERSDLAARLGHCRVLRAVRPQDEGADLFDRVGAKADRRPLLVIRVRPGLLLDPTSLAGFLRHELMHIADMVDPRFGYSPTLPALDDGPSAANLVRDRYRTLWDVTIDGRLARRGSGSAQIRAQRAREFAVTFRMLGSANEAVFEEWFDRVDPTHEQLVAFAMNPGASCGAGAARCPLCRFPVASLDSAPERLSPHARRQIEREHPEWHPADGLCVQCLDLYEAQNVGRDCAS
jgi:hypothetical protein